MCHTVPWGQLFCFPECTMPHLREVVPVELLSCSNITKVCKAVKYAVLSEGF